MLVRQEKCLLAPDINFLTHHATGTGFFKANISPLLAEQNTDRRMRVETLPTGERVIVDPAVTNSRIVSELKDIDPATRSCLFDSQQCHGVLNKYHLMLLA